MGEKISVKKETVSRLESGRISLTITRLQQLAVIFGCSVNDLLNAPTEGLHAQAATITDMLRLLSVEERESVVHFVGAYACLWHGERADQKFSQKCVAALKLTAQKGYPVWAAFFILR